MVNEMTQSNTNMLTDSVITHGGDVGLGQGTDNVSNLSGIMGMDIKSDLETVTENLEGLIREGLSPSITQISGGKGKSSDDLTIGEDVVDPPITGVDTGQTDNLVFTDTETGILNSEDQTYGGRYRDEYILRGVGDNEKVVLDLEGLGFNSSLQLVNRETGKLIDHYEMKQVEGISEGQLMFMGDGDTEYLVRVTSIGETMTGNYTLKTTAGNLTLGVSDQIIKGSLTDTDQVSQMWGGRYSDQYEITNLSPLQTVTIKYTTADYATQLILFNADTGGRMRFSRNTYSEEDGLYSAEMSFTVNPDINYGVLVSSYQMYQTGDYTLSISSDASVSGGFDVGDDQYHPILKNRLMDNYKLSNVQVGQDVELNLNSDSGNNIIQLFNQKTGDILKTTTEQNLKFTVEDNIDYAVRVLGQDGETYTLTTDSGFLFDSTVIDINETQTIEDSLNTLDTVNVFRPITYMDGYYLDADTLTVGQTIKLALDSRDFDPDLYIINANTGEIIQRRASYSFRSYLKFEVEEGIDYLLVASSRIYGRVGDYTLQIIA